MKRNWNCIPQSLVFVVFDVVRRRHMSTPFSTCRFVWKKPSYSFNHFFYLLTVMRDVFTFHCNGLRQVHGNCASIGVPCIRLAHRVCLVIISHKYYEHSVHSNFPFAFHKHTLNLLQNIMYRTRRFRSIWEVRGRNNGTEKKRTITKLVGGITMHRQAHIPHSWYADVGRLSLST